MADVTYEEMERQLAALRAENADIKERRRRELASKTWVRVNREKGSVSVGVGARFPVTLSATQWPLVASVMETILLECSDPDMIVAAELRHEELRQERAKDRK